MTRKSIIEVDEHGETWHAGAAILGLVIGVILSIPFWGCLLTIILEVL